MILNPIEQFRKARDTQRKSDLTQIQKALDLYNIDHGSYPESLPFGGALEPYMQVVPNDPVETEQYVYEDVNNGEGYRLYAKLERCTDSQKITEAACEDPFTYSVVSPNLSVIAFSGTPPAPRERRDVVKLFGIGDRTSSPTPKENPTPTAFFGYVSGNPTPATTKPTSGPSPTPTPNFEGPCTLTSAYWSNLHMDRLSSNPISEGEDGILNIKGTGGCNNEQVHVYIYEDDGILGSEHVRSTTAYLSSGNNNSISISWAAPYQPDCVVGGIALCDPPEYYFIAFFSGQHQNTAIRSASPDLQVIKANTSAVRVFATRTTYNGNLGGLAGADAKCQTSADARSLGGTWKAWLSDDATSATDRLNHHQGPHRLLNGTMIATTWGDLTDGTLKSGIDVDEFGRQIPQGPSGESGVYAWSGSYYTGKSYLGGSPDASTGTVENLQFKGRNCQNWSSNDGRFGGVAGSGIGTDFTWSGAKLDNSSVSSRNCADPASLYCFEQSVTEIETNAPRINYRRVFITSQNWHGDLGGVTGADAKCQAAAGSENLGGTWKAWISDSQTAATYRLGHSAVPYKLLSGTTVADNWADLTDGNRLISGINIDESGKKGGGSNIWTGTTLDGLYTGSSCNDWATPGVSIQGTVGNLGADSDGGGWTAFTRSSCNNASKLYCFEQSAADPTPPPLPSCVNGYLDTDKDGYGVGTQGCFLPSSAYNIVGNNTDCYDTKNDVAGKVYPGQTAYFASPYGENNSFDYNCDGSNTQASQDYYYLTDLTTVPPDSCQTLRSVNGYVSRYPWGEQPCGSEVYADRGSVCAGYRYKGCSDCFMWSSASNPMYVTCH